MIDDERKKIEEDIKNGVPSKTLLVFCTKHNLVDYAYSWLFNTCVDYEYYIGLAALRKKLPYEIWDVFESMLIGYSIVREKYKMIHWVLSSSKDVPKLLGGVITRLSSGLTVGIYNFHETRSRITAVFKYISNINKYNKFIIIIILLSSF